MGIAPCKIPAAPRMLGIRLEMLEPGLVDMSAVLRVDLVAYPDATTRFDLLLKELSGRLFPEDENEDNPLYVISTESECYRSWSKMMAI